MNTTSTSGNSKPALTGHKARTRKAEKKATKYDPEWFKRELVALLAPCINKTSEFGELEEQDVDFSKVSSVLENAANTMDFRRYEEPLFETLLTGGLLGSFF